MNRKERKVRIEKMLIMWKFFFALFAYFAVGVLYLRALRVAIP
jgi:hypothetical protein